MDAVQHAKSGHPGAPMGMADIAEVLWNDHLRHNPANPAWPDRDRFVLSNGHASMLLYALLHLSGYALPMEQIRNFRQLHSATPGHPEVGDTPGVETTTGPLGQGLAHAVGMAIAERNLAARFNRPDCEVVDHRTYAFAGDGCLMEGVSYEACSLAGTLGLGKLIVLYDDNGVSIDGAVRGWFTEDVPARFRACGWHVVEAIDGHDPAAVDRALRAARAETARPSLLQCRTVIGMGAPGKQGQAACHGAPLGDDEIARARRELDWDAPPFEIPDDIRGAWDARDAGARAERAWRARLDDYRQRHPELAAEFERRLDARLPDDWPAAVERQLAALRAEDAPMATRKASGRTLAAFGAALPELIGGSADLAESNNTLRADARPLASDPGGDYIHFGVREFGMSAIAAGLALHGGFIPYAATFLTFSDYARNAVRMAALMKRRVVFVYTHDSIGLGEDGPTHQPVEHASSLRLIPNLDVWRPCDAIETACAWRAAVERRDGPSALLLSRQGLPPMTAAADPADDIARGGYVLFDSASGAAPELIILATGSEVAPAREAAERLAQEGRRVRLVSLPCAELFERQDASYRRKLLPEGPPRLAVEAGVGAWWRGYVGLDGAVLGVEEFGRSAPAKDVFHHFGLHVNGILRSAGALLAGAPDAAGQTHGD